MNRRHTRRAGIAAILAALVAAPLAAVFPALAGERDMLLVLPGFPGTSAQAQPYIDKMLRHIEGELGWPAGSMEGRYLSDAADGVAALESDAPGLALVDPSVYAGEHRARGMKVIAKVEVDGRGAQTYSVIVREGGPGAVAELAGKRISGAVTHDPRYVANVILDGKVAPGDLELDVEARPLRSLRAVVRGKADAAIVDQSVVEHLPELPFAAQAEVLHTAEPVPAPAVVVMGAGAKNAGAIRGALVGLCGRPDGAELCKTLTLTAIRAATNKDYKALLARYDR